MAFYPKIYFCILITIGICPSLEAQITNSFTEPAQQSEVAAAEPGIVVEICVEEGQRVTQGQILAKLNHGVLEQNLRLAKIRANSEARVNTAASIMRLKKMQLENMRKLIDQGHANQYEVEELDIQMKSAEADWNVARVVHNENQIQVEKIQAEIERRFIRSPIDGVVTKLHKNEGEFLSGSQPVFATVARLDQLKVRFYLSVEEVRKLKEKRTVEVLTTTDRIPVTARIEFISPVFDPQSETGRVDITIENQSLNIPSGIPCFWPPSQTGRGKGFSVIPSGEDHNE